MKAINTKEIVCPKTGITAHQAGSLCALAVTQLGGEVLRGNGRRLSPAEASELLAENARRLIRMVIADVRTGNGWGNEESVAKYKALAERAEIAMRSEEFAVMAAIAMAGVLNQKERE